MLAVAPASSDPVEALAAAAIGAPAVRGKLDGVPVLIGEFWTARQRQAHRIHEVSYRACFKPQLPGFFIQRFTEPGETVFDPFMGRGTTPIEAAILGRAPMGSDVNPLSLMLARPRLAPPPLAAVVQRLAEVDWTWSGEAPPELSVFYHPQTLAELCTLRAWLLARAAERGLDPVDDWIRMVALNRLTGHSAGFFSVYTLPPNQAVSAAAQARINALRGQAPPRRVVPELIARRSRTLLCGPTYPAADTSRLFVSPSHAVPAAPTASAALAVTSPPFLDVVDYAADNWLRAWFAGIDPAAVAISGHRRPEDWRAFVAATLAELARVVRPGGHVAFEVGEVRKGALPLEALVLQAAAGLPLDPVCVLINRQAFTKTAHVWGVDNNAKGVNSNRIVLMRRR